MALSYNVWTEDEIKNRGLVEPGNYPFQINAVLKTKTKGGKDKNGNEKPIRDMLEIEFDFWDIAGNLRKQKDWIVFMPNMDWKLRHLADTTGNLTHYESKTLHVNHLLNAKGVFSIGVKDVPETDGTTRKSNFVKEYIKKSDIKEVKNDSDFNDPIPF